MMKWLALRRFNHIDAVGFALVARAMGETGNWWLLLWLLPISVVSAAIEVWAERTR